MATQAAAQILSKGPLSSALSQWVFLGLGTYMVIFKGDDTNVVSRAAHEIAHVAYRLVAGFDGGGGEGGWRSLLREERLHQQHLQQHQQPIVIHSHHSSDTKSNRSWIITTIIQVGLGAGACWTAYLLFTNCLPESMKEMMPVTRKFFETAVTSLGQGILRVRDALSEQIGALGIKQDELSKKQDETHDKVLGLRDDIGDVRLHMDDISAAISRCESSLSDAADRQTYMSRGVRLLVQCVGDLLRPSNPSVARELDQFGRLSAELMDSEEFHYDGNQNRGGQGAKNQLEYPSSPILSEIGSITSSVDDRNHHHPNNMRALSLPRPRRSDMTTSTPSSSNNTVHTTSYSMSKMMMSSSQPNNGLMNQRPTSRVLKMLQSFNINGTVTKGNEDTNHRRYSSPEDEVPQSNYDVSSSSSSSASFSGHVTPYSETSDVVDPIRLEEVDELLRIVRSGGGALLQAAE
jgi:hypothetical protein